MNRTRNLLSVLLGATLLAGCGADAPEVPEGQEVIGESIETTAADGEHQSLAIAGYCDNVTTWNSTWTSFEDQVLTLVNQKRAAGASCGGVYKPPTTAVVLDTRLRCAARKHSMDMGANNFFSHTGSNGSTFAQRITNAGYTYTAAGENIAAGQATPTAVVDGWMKSTGHCNNIMNPDFKHLGVGYSYASGATYRHYWTQDFGRP